jgi:peptidoglycan L-alanyl-D-glutamate endopeptidase CwlK
MKLNDRSERALKGVHPDLVKVVRRAAAITKSEFIITEGLRTVARQKQLVAAGASKTMNSRHITGHAVDVAVLVGGKVRWDWGLYVKVAEDFRAAAIELKIPIRWGGTWTLLSSIKGPITASMLHKRFPDGPHFELLAKAYPA